MGIQISSLSLGSNNTVNPQPDFIKEKQIPSPIEQKAAVDRVNVDRINTNLGDEQKPKTQDLKKTVQDLEQITLAFNRRLKFVVDQDSQQIIVKVIDNETDKVIKVLPPEELQRVHNRIRETIGFLFDRMV